MSLSLSSVHVKLLVSSLPDGVCPRPDANGGGADGAELGQIHCLIDLMTLSLDVSMTFLWSLILIYTVRLRSSASSSIERYPLHDTRWLLCLCLMVNRLAELASCLIVAISGPLVGSHQLALYLPLFDIFTLIICCIFYDRIEVQSFSPIAIGWSIKTSDRKCQFSTSLALVSMIQSRETNISGLSNSQETSLNF